MEKKQDPTIKVSRMTLNRLLDKKESEQWKSCDAIIASMLTYMDEMGVNLHRGQIKEPIVKVMQQLEDIVRMIKSEEKDLLRPAMEFILNGGSMESRDEMLCKLANENQKLREGLSKLRKENLELENKVNVLRGNEARYLSEYNGRIFALKDFVITECDPEKFEKIMFSNSVRIPMDFFTKLKKDIEEQFPIQQ